MRMRNSERGMSLVEVTIILAVIGLLTSVAAPSISDYIEDTRQVRAKHDVQAIGGAIVRLVRDTGMGCLSTTPSPLSTACTKTNRVDLLLSTGNYPVTTAADYAAPGGTNSAAAANNNWMGGTTPVGVANRRPIWEQFVDNAPGYPSVTFTAGGGAKPGSGWRGAYLESAGPDPWGFVYQANTMFLLPASNASAGATNGLVNGGWINDVIVISPGRDSTIATPFGSDTTGATAVTGDDLVYIVSGSSR